MADPISPDGIGYQIGAFAGAFVAAILAWFAALRKKPDTAMQQMPDLRTQLLVAELKRQLSEDAEETRENLRLVLEAHRTTLEHKLENYERELNGRVGSISDRLRNIELDVARLRPSRH